MVTSDLVASNAGHAELSTIVEMPEVLPVAAISSHPGREVIIKASTLTIEAAFKEIENFPANTVANINTSLAKMRTISENYSNKNRSVSQTHVDNILVSRFCGDGGSRKA